MRAYLEHKTTNKIASESKTAIALDVLLQKLQTLKTKSGQLQQEIQEQRKEVKAMGDKLNAVLIEMQTISLRFDMLFGAGDSFDAGNVEGAQWPKLGEDQNVETGTPQTVPKKERELASITF